MEIRDKVDIRGDDGDLVTSRDDILDGKSKSDVVTPSRFAGVWNTLPYQIGSDYFQLIKIYLTLPYVTRNASNVIKKMSTLERPGHAAEIPHKGCSCDNRTVSSFHV